MRQVYARAQVFETSASAAEYEAMAEHTNASLVRTQSATIDAKS
jgi:hypothetical protein